MLPPLSHVAPERIVATIDIHTLQIAIIQRRELKKWPLSI